MEKNEASCPIYFVINGTVFITLVTKLVMEDQKKKDEQKNESEIAESLKTEFPLSGGETDEDFESALKDLFSIDEEKENGDNKNDESVKQ